MILIIIIDYVKLYILKRIYFIFSGNLLKVIFVFVGNLVFIINLINFSFLNRVVILILSFF